MLPRSSRTTLGVVLLTLVRLVVLLVGALLVGSVVVFDEYANVTDVSSYSDVADVDQTFLIGLGQSGGRGEGEHQGRRACSSDQLAHRDTLLRFAFVSLLSLPASGKSKHK